MTKARLIHELNEVLRRGYGIDQPIEDPITVRDLATAFSVLSKQMFLCAAAISALAVAPLDAAEKQKSYSFNVLSGKPHRVDTYLSWKNNCVGVIGNAREIAKPKHGTATSKIETTKINRANTGSVQNCRGKKI